MPFLKSAKVLSLGVMDRMEIGWMQIFNVLMARNLRFYDLNTSQQETIGSTTQDTRYAQRAGKGVDSIYSATISDIMRAMNSPTKIHKSRMTLNGFLTRLRNSTPQINQTMINNFRALMDVNDTRTPTDLFGV